MNEPLAGGVEDQERASMAKVPEYETPELRELGRVEDLTRWEGSVVIN
jgi:hypothetical protein